MTHERVTSTPRRAAIAFIFITVLLDMLALGMIIPVLPLLIEEIRGGNTADRGPALPGTAHARRDHV